MFPSLYLYNPSSFIYEPLNIFLYSSKKEIAKSSSANISLNFKLYSAKVFEASLTKDLSPNRYKTSSLITNNSSFSL